MTRPASTRATRGLGYPLPDLVTAVRRGRLQWLRRGCRAVTSNETRQNSQAAVDVADRVVSAGSSRTASDGFDRRSGSRQRKSIDARARVMAPSIERPNTMRRSAGTARMTTSSCSSSISTVYVSIAACPHHRQVPGVSITTPSSVPERTPAVPGPATSVWPVPEHALVGRHNPMLSCTSTVRPYLPRHALGFAGWLKLRPAARSSSPRASDSGRQRRKRAGCLSQRPPPSNVVYATSQIEIGGTGHQPGTAACWPLSRNGAGTYAKASSFLDSLTAPDRIGGGVARARRVD
jgi:hypothetical protein